MLSSLVRYARALAFFLWRAGTGRHAYIHLADSVPNRVAFAVAHFCAIAFFIVGLLVDDVLARWEMVLFLLIAGAFVFAAWQRKVIADFERLDAGPLSIGVNAALAASWIAMLMLSTVIGHWWALLLGMPLMRGNVVAARRAYGRLPEEMRGNGYMPSR